MSEQSKPNPTHRQVEVIAQVLDVRREQDEKHENENHCAAEWILIIEKQLNDAKIQWYKGNYQGTLREIAHIGACSVACLEQHNYDPEQA